MILNNKNILLYAAKHYKNVFYLDEELETDLNRISTIMRAVTKWKRGEDINIRMILNNIIIMHNVFGVEATREMLFYKMRAHWDVLCAIYDWMDLLPISINIGDLGLVNISKVEKNKLIQERLEKL